MKTRPISNLCIQCHWYLTKGKETFPLYAMKQINERIDEEEAITAYEKLIGKVKYFEPEPELICTIVNIGDLKHIRECFMKLKEKFKKSEQIKFPEDVISKLDEFVRAPCKNALNTLIYGIRLHAVDEMSSISFDDALRIKHLITCSRRLDEYFKTYLGVILRRQLESRLTINYPYTHALLESNEAIFDVFNAAHDWKSYVKSARGILSDVSLFDVFEEV